MSEHHPARTANPLNANLVALVMVAMFLLIGGIILTRTSEIEATPESGVEVALAAATVTVEPPTATPIPPTDIPTIPTTPVPATAVPESTGVAGGQPAAASAGSYDPALVAQGEQLFLLCSACHGLDARGLPNLGKDLVASEFVSGLTDEELRDFVKTGRPMWDPLNTTGVDMPPKGGNPAITDDDILAIIAYIRTLRANSAGEATGSANTTETVAATSYDPVLVSQGEQLFLLCSACHGPDARGLPNLGKDLVVSEFVGGLTDEELRDFVKTGRPIWDALNTTGVDMPPKGGNPAMTDDDLMAIIAYIRTLRTNADVNVGG